MNYLESHRTSTNVQRLLQWIVALSETIIGDKLLQNVEAYVQGLL